MGAAATLWVSSFVCVVVFVLRGFWIRRPANQIRCKLGIGIKIVAFAVPLTDIWRP